jgi:hypothetical protein
MLNPAKEQHRPPPQRGFLASVVLGLVFGLMSGGIVGAAGLVAVFVVLGGGLREDDPFGAFAVLFPFFALFAGAAGLLAGALIGVLDRLLNNELSAPSVSLWSWVPTGGTMGAIGAVLVMGLVYLFLGGSNDPEAIGFALVVSLLFGLIGGLVAGPVFGLLFRRRTKLSQVPQGGE